MSSSTAANSAQLSKEREMSIAGKNNFIGDNNATTTCKVILLSRKLPVLSPSSVCKAAMMSSVSIDP